MINWEAWQEGIAIVYGPPLVTLLALGVAGVVVFVFLWFVGRAINEALARNRPK